MYLMRERIGTKRYGWTVAFLLFLLAILTWIILRVDPEVVKDIPIKNSYLFFVLPACIFLFLLTAIALNSSKLGVWWTLTIIFSFYLKVNQVWSGVSGLLLLGVAVCGHLYIRYTWRN